MLPRSPEFRYLISTTNPYFLSVSVVNDTITIYVASQDTDTEQAFVFGKSCNEKYQEQVPKVVNVYNDESTHVGLHSEDIDEVDVPHIHYKHTEAGIITRATLYKHLHHFQKCVPGQHGLTNEILKDIDLQYKEFKTNEKTGGLKSGELFETSNNPVYKNHKAKESSRLPTIPQHTNCILDNKFSRGCEFSYSSTQWMVPRLIMCKAQDKPKEAYNNSQCPSEKSITNNHTPIGSISSLVSNVAIVGAFLLHLGFFSCLKRRCKKSVAKAHLTQSSNPR